MTFSVISWDAVFIYLDDILIFSPDIPTHPEQVSQVLGRLLENQLFVKLEKSESHVTQTTFLCFIISSRGVSLDPSRVTTITTWAVPKTINQVQRFLGFANFFQRFIKGYSTQQPH